MQDCCTGVARYPGKIMLAHAERMFLTLGSMVALQLAVMRLELPPMPVPVLWIFRNQLI
jgi:hypothetical protein